MIARDSAYSAVRRRGWGWMRGRRGGQGRRQEMDEFADWFEISQPRALCSFSSFLVLVPHCSPSKLGAQRSCLHVLRSPIPVTLTSLRYLRHDQQPWQQQDQQREQRARGSGSAEATCSVSLVIAPCYTTLRVSCVPAPFVLDRDFGLVAGFMHRYGIHPG